MIKNRKLTITLVIYCILLYGAWAIFELLVKDGLLALTDKNDVVMQLVRSGIIKNLVWTLPALLLVKHFEKDMAVSLKEMFTAKFQWLSVLPIFLVCIVLPLMSAWKRNGLAIADSFGWSQVIMVVFVGITEESVFRGWLLNSTLKYADTEAKQWLVIGINAVLFLVIHFPIWIHDGVFLTSFQSFGFITILLLSGVFSWLFVKTKNLLVPVALHMLYDLVVVMFIG